MKLSHSICISAVLVLISQSVVVGDDWPRYRNANVDARSAETGLLSEWPEGGPPLVWTADGVGTGYSSVAIVGDRIYTMGDVDEMQYVFAISAADGEPLWKTNIGSANPGSYVGSRSTPTWHEGMLFCMNTDAVLVCLDADTGDEIWKRDLVADFGGQIMLAKGEWNWRFSESPLVDGDRVIVTPGGSDAMMVALNTKTGEEIWRCQIPELGEKGMDGAGYSSAVISNACGVRQYVQLAGRGVIGVDAETGKFLWGYNGVANDVANISTPVIDEDYVFASTGYQTGAALLELTRSDDGEFQVEEKYFLGPRTFENHHGGFLLDGEYIYGGHGHKLGLPVCIRLADGEVMWGPIRNDGQASAAVCYADGHLYFRYQNGLMVLIEATPDEYREKGSFMIPRVRAESWSHPVVSGGRLYLKEQERLLCYDISE